MIQKYKYIINIYYTCIFISIYFYVNIIFCTQGISQLIDENSQIDEKIDIKNIKKEQLKDGQQTPSKTSTGPTTTPDQKPINQKDIIRNWESEAIRELKTQLKLVYYKTQFI